MNVSVFKNIKQTTNGEQKSLVVVLEAIRDGKWQDEILRVRNAKDKKEKDFQKSFLPYFTVCGIFSRRAISGLTEHSGFIALDFDDVENPAEFRDLIAADKYCFSAFISAGGKGVCAIFRVGKVADNEENHAAYIALSEYAHEKYGYIETDPSCKDISRARYISYDPALFLNEKAEIFKGRKKVKVSEKKEITAFAQVPISIEDLEYICAQIEERDIDLASGYSDWLSVCFALISEFGAAARPYFHRISAISAKYSPSKCDKQFDACLRNHCDLKENKVSYGSFLKLCSDNGIKKQTETTKEIVSKAISQKRAGKDAQSVIEYLQKENQISPERSSNLVKQVFENDKIADPKADMSPIERLQSWVKGKGLRYNEVTLYLEKDGEKLLDMDFNSLYIQFLTEEFGGHVKVSESIFKKYIFSNEIPKVNPITDYFDSLSMISAKGYIAKLAGTLKCKTGILIREDFCEHFLKKWLVGIVAIAYGGPTDTILVLTGTPGVGKTQFFRNILPAQIEKYATAMRIDGTKDDFINFATHALVYFDDLTTKNEKGQNELEMTGRFKYIVTSDRYTIRRPYAAAAESMNRRCGFGISTNDREIIKNITEERRTVIFELKEHFYEEMMNFYGKDGANKNLVWAEAVELYREWKSTKGWLLSRDEVAQLQKSLWDFVKIDTLEDLLISHLEPAQSYMTARQILEGLNNRTSINLARESAESIGKAMRTISARYPDFAKDDKRRAYRVKFKDEFSQNNTF